MAALAGDLEGDVVGSVALDLNGTRREVVEVLVQQLDEAHKTIHKVSKSITKGAGKRSLRN